MTTASTQYRNTTHDRNTGGISDSFNKTLLFTALLSCDRRPGDESDLHSSLGELLERESQSEVFVQGISYALFKVAGRGLTDVAEILLRYGADLNFEGENKM